METLPTFNNLKSLSHQLSVQIEDLRVLDNNDLRARRKATATARRLLDELIHPEEAAAEQIITLSEWASIRMFMKWKFFDRIPLKGSISYEELAASIGAEEALVIRMGQMLVSTGKLLQPAPNHVAHSRLSPSYKTGDRNGYSFAMHHDDFQPVLSSLPAYFDKYGSRLPKGKTEIPMSFAAGADGRLTPWEIFARQGKEHLEQFGFAMQAMPNYAWPFTGAYDFSWVEEYASADPERLLIVDVGGSYGHALRANLVKYQGIPRSRCVVEDRSEMIPNIREAHAGDEVMRDVRKVAANFHDEQPVKGALIYLIRRCIHDYDDDDCVNILKILAESLPENEPRARILINEQIMTESPHRWVAAMDIIMMTWASLERSEQQFGKLANRAGLAVVKVHKAEGETSM
ncbi:S-adenosyl-L-methionine-dependent methyltransferase [Hypoxylon fragiforme]|uniref:S-adenosyl-L-methionine-dependent methyltransferase n=1 Tax=Hypoxylon fragiforme TaxID=63214 RepID=UPI0020C687B3|nr:S-adenosyl-L-methionine-dependent methyltransferase [Hypoxylon fragiforme]KAI2613923.1 S-adenosyl-L-methionine-dependent methyltransferase [Hypoxylon fragiforme]